MSRTEFGLPAEQRTTFVDGMVEAIPGMGVCDFCTSTPVVMAYPCGLVVLETEVAAHASNDPWGACAHCADLIEADDREGLVQRALGGFIVTNGEQPNGVLVEIAQLMRDLQAAFFAARTGDGESV